MRNWTKLYKNVISSLKRQSNKSKVMIRLPNKLSQSPCHSTLRILRNCCQGHLGSYTTLALSHPHSHPNSHNLLAPLCWMTQHTCPVIRLRPWDKCSNHNLTQISSWPYPRQTDQLVTLTSLISVSRDCLSGSMMFTFAAASTSRSEWNNYRLIKLLILVMWRILMNF